MAKAKPVYVCQQCGARYPKWSGRCENCGEWNTLVEEVAAPDKKAAVDRSSGKSLAAQKIAEIQTEQSAQRIVTGFSEVDEVLGGGMVPGGVVLLAGQPGIGKSTLLMQMALQIG